MHFEHSVSPGSVLTYLWIARVHCIYMIGPYVQISSSRMWITLSGQGQYQIIAFLLPFCNLWMDYPITHLHLDQRTHIFKDKKYRSSKS
jgi:hypothetical protein